MPGPAETIAAAKAATATAAATAAAKNPLTVQVGAAKQATADKASKLAQFTGQTADPDVNAPKTVDAGLATMAAQLATPAPAAAAAIDPAPAPPPVSSTLILFAVAIALFLLTRKIK